MEPLVIIAFGEYGDCSIEEEILKRELGARVVYTKTIHSPEARDLARGADAIAISIEKYPAELLATFANCKIISRFGTGLDNIDLAAAAEHGILVTNVPDAFVEEVSTHTIALLLACNRHLVSLANASHAGRWENQGRNICRLRDQVLGLVGFGYIARATATKARGLGLQVIAYDPFVGEEAFRGYGVRPVSLAELLAESDYVSLHLPVTEATRQIIDAGRLASMKPGAYLINTSRGMLIDEGALLAAVRTGQIRGAALDVRATEPPPPDDPLMREDNILITPHMAWCSVEATASLRRRASQEIVRVLRGEKPEHPANQPKPRRQSETRTT